MTSQRSEHFFTIRIWQESGQEETGTWRGLVVHVRSDQRLYFTTLADLNDFITLHIHHGRTIASSCPTEGDEDENPKP